MDITEQMREQETQDVLALADSRKGEFEIMVVYITIRVSKSRNDTVLLTSHAMKETWEDARQWVASQCEHHNAGGWFVAWRISDNRSSSVETGESDCLASKSK